MIQRSHEAPQPYRHKSKGKTMISSNKAGKRRGVVLAVMSAVFSLVLGLFVAVPVSAAEQGEGVENDSSVEGGAVNAQGTLGSIWKVIKGAKSVYDFGALCAKNQDADRSCFTSDEANRFGELNIKLDLLIQRQAENQEKVMATLQEIYVQLKTDDLKREIDKIRIMVEVQISTAADKVSEYVCGQQYIDALSKGEGHDGCSVTDSAGNKDAEATAKYGRPMTVADLYADGGQSPRGNAQGGLVARLVAATVGKWTNSDDKNDQENALVAKGQDLMQAIAGGSQVFGPENGILNAFIASLSSELRAQQKAAIGQRPVFLTSDFLQAMNELSEYWVNQEALYFATTIAALQLRDQKSEGDPQPIAAVLGRMTELGVNSGSSGSQHPEWALDTQLSDYSFTETNPQDSWVIQKNGTINRLRLGTTVPTFKQVQAVKEAIEQSDIKMSQLQSLYPKLLPQGKNAAWTANLGTKRLKRFQIRTTVKRYEKNPWKNINYYVPDPEAANKTYFGEKYSVTTNNKCQVQVRMWDQKPSMKEVADSDMWYSNAKFDNSKDGKYKFPTIVRGNGSKYDKIKTNSREQFDAYVTNGAVPIYDYSDNYGFSNGKLKLFGVGTLFRCNGKFGPFSRAVDLQTVSIQDQPRDGLWKKLVSKP